MAAFLAIWVRGVTRPSRTAARVLSFVYRLPKKSYHHPPEGGEEEVVFVTCDASVEKKELVAHLFVRCLLSFGFES